MFNIKFSMQSGYKKKFLYLPIETKVRELDSKLLLSIEALERGYSVVIGSDSFLQKLDKLPNGVLVHKDALNIRTKIFEMAKKNGNKVCVNDEEGSVVFNWERYINKRVSTNALEFTDAFMCWGMEQKKNLESLQKKHDVELYVTGHPRVDLLRHPLNSYNMLDNINENIILVNTHFSICNYLDGEEKLVELLRNSNVINNEDDLKRHERHINYKSALMKEYISLIEKLSCSFVNHQIVVRPHPSENEDTWKKIFVDKENVVISKKESVGYWINRAALVIHTGCTTAVEAFISNKLAIAFKPIVNNEFDVSLPDAISERVKNVNSCIDVVESVLANKYDFKKYKTDGTEILKSNIMMESEFSYEKILNVIDDLNLNDSCLSLSKLKRIFFMTKVKSKIASIVRKIISKKMENNKFEKTEVNEIILTMKNLIQSNPNFNPNEIDVTELCYNVFYITRKID